MSLRKTLMTFAAVGALPLSAVAFAAGVALQTPPPPGPGLDLINERCGFCHTTAQVTGVRKTRAGWEQSVHSMIDRGAELTPEEEKVMVDYLATHLLLAEPAAPAPAKP